ncbi:RNA polymerase sigma factor [Quadrisphaera setariae]|uniref:RNA polymerase sigma factor n=1 Tax=Quadrisphaera setariae TaxID=2593304 RepID=UPI0021084A1F|nr:SigE family RNA polymerase sigma factor [Quadrisphaera setariae]
MSIASLLRRPRADQAWGFEDLVAARSGPLLSMARGLVRSEADAEDLVQEVLAKALVSWERVSAASDPAAYVNRMLVNQAMSFWRRASTRRERSTEPEELPEPVSGGVDDGAVQRGDRDALLTALRRLPPRHRAVLVLRYYEQLPDAEIADLLGMAQATVRSSAARGLAALRRDGVLTDGSVSRSEG